MKQCTEKNPCFGFKNPSQLINLKKFKIIEGFVPDYMHIIAGIGKQFANMWFGSSKESSRFVKKDEMDVINETMDSIKAPHQICRLTRSLKDKEFWKAREWENWTLYYSSLILHFSIDRRYVLHWILLVEALYILLKSEISITELNRADILLHQFVIGTEALYSKLSMTYNVHIPLHLAKSVLNWGPLYAHSAFGFESGNFKLLKIIHAANGVHYQVCRHINLNYSYNTLKKHVYSIASSDVQTFCSKLGTSMIKNSIKLSDSRYFGTSSDVRTIWTEKLDLSHRARSYKKMVKGGCLYLSSTKENRRSNNAFAKLIDGSYVEIIEFVVDKESTKEFVIVKQLRTRPAFTGQLEMLQKITSIADRETVIPTADLTKVCVNINIQK